MVTLSIIKADTGGWVGHSAVHGDQVREAQRRMDEAIASGLLAATSAQRLSLIAGKYVGKDDPVMIVRCQSGLPAVGETVEQDTPARSSLFVGVVDHEGDLALRGEPRQHPERRRGDQDRSHVDAVVDGKHDRPAVVSERIRPTECRPNGSRQSDADISRKWPLDQ
jgi:hypothetical protein